MPDSLDIVAVMHHTEVCTKSIGTYYEVVERRPESEAYVISPIKSKLRERNHPLRELLSVRQKDEQTNAKKLIHRFKSTTSFALFSSCSISSLDRRTIVSSEILRPALLKARAHGFRRL